MKNDDPLTFGEKSLVAISVPLLLYFLYATIAQWLVCDPSPYALPEEACHQTMDNL